MRTKIRNAFVGLMSGLLLLAGLAAPAAAQIVTVPTDLMPGDQYRLAFVTSTQTAATSADINYYNDFVQAVADTVPELAAVGPWRVIGSTDMVDAQDNTGTNWANDPVGVPIYSVEDRKIANGNLDLWNGNISWPIRMTEQGALYFSIYFTGTNKNGGAEPFYELGGVRLNTMSGRADTLSRSWIRWGVRSHNEQWPVLAMSGVLTVAGQDSDGDGVPDDEDVCEGHDDNADLDSDGIPDGCDECPADPDNDADGDGVCGDVDQCLGDDAFGNSDGDLLCDDLDPCFGASNSDVDGDGVCDEGDLCLGDDATGNDDADGVCNDLDVCIGDDAFGDTDSDGTCDDIDPCPVDAENDADGDGVCEVDDNCDAEANANQSDNDGDGAGDVCDSDDDNDGVEDGADNCSLAANADQLDFDGDGAGDVCDTDDDNDGVLDAVDACETAIGDLVNVDGCSIANLCPCDNNWKNHGAYVRCVSHAANDFKDAGLIGETEHGDIVSEAGQSACGKKIK